MVPEHVMLAAVPLIALRILRVLRALVFRPARAVLVRYTARLTGIGIRILIGATVPLHVFMSLPRRIYLIAVQVTGALATSAQASSLRGIIILSGARQVAALMFRHGRITVQRALEERTTGALQAHALVFVLMAWTMTAMGTRTARIRIAADAVSARQAHAALRLPGAIKRQESRLAAHASNARGPAHHAALLAAVLPAAIVRARLAPVLRPPVMVLALVSTSPVSRPAPYARPAPGQAIPARTLGQQPILTTIAQSAGPVVRQYASKQARTATAMVRAHVLLGLRPALRPENPAAAEQRLQRRVMPLIPAQRM